MTTTLPHTPHHPPTSTPIPQCQRQPNAPLQCPPTSMTTPRMPPTSPNILQHPPMPPNIDNNTIHTPNIPQCQHLPLIVDDAATHPLSSSNTPQYPTTSSLSPGHPYLPLGHHQQQTQVHQVSYQDPARGSQDLPVPVKKVKKTPKANKKNKTSADCDEEDKEAEEPSVKTMTAILNESDKGKERDLTNLGSSDAEDEPEEKDDNEDLGEEKKLSDEVADSVDDDEKKEKTSSEEEKEKTLSDEKDLDAGDDQKSDDSADDKKPDSSGEDAMDLDPNVTPCNPPASKRQASAFPIAHYHIAQHSKADHADDTTPLPAPMFANFDDYLLPSSLIADDVNDLQGASRTMGGFARGKGHGVVSNMADFNTQPADLVPVRNEGRVLVYKNEDHTSAKACAVRVPLAYTLGPVLKAMVKKMTTLADSDISLWVKDDWEMKGPFAVAVGGDEPIEWDNNKEMELLMEPSTQGSGFHPPPSPSVYSAAAPSTISSLAPSASVSTADIFARMKAAALVQDQWLELKNAGKWTGRDLNIDELSLLYICKTNYNTYAKMFENAQKFPILHSLLNDLTYNNNLQEHKAVWGTRQLTKENLAAITKELQNKQNKEERAAEKARVAKEKKGKRASTSNFSLQALVMLLSLWLLLGLLLCVAAAPLEDPFPNILFVDFAKVIKSSFGADITLA
ncbi:hypothetical protein BDN71DRAFT_1431092 [Pleurotus eryngii]|uniref:Uncharacterized protein n=1 Tax=Pleurotus eryngii TaxID=5323 RepID=A0A9P5ZXK8_PLEER|nr:hypothetical protein BDN71DRAFT_1431092 [Pleurotus eryngii]